MFTLSFSVCLSSFFLTSLPVLPFFLPCLHHSFLPSLLSLPSFLFFLPLSFPCPDVSFMYIHMYFLCKYTHIHMWSYVCLHTNTYTHISMSLIYITISKLCHNIYTHYIRIVYTSSLLCHIKYVSTHICIWHNVLI